MSTLNVDWKPRFGTIFTWFSMDKAGRIAVMVNNCFGDLPKALLIKKDIEFLLDAINEYIWEESALYLPYPKEKMVLLSWIYILHGVMDGVIPESI